VTVKQIRAGVMPATDVRKGLLGNGCVQKDCLSSSSLVDSRNELLTFGYDAHKTRGKSRMCATYLTVRNPSNPVLLLRRQPPTFCSRLDKTTVHATKVSEIKAVVAPGEFSNPYIQNLLIFTTNSTFENTTQERKKGKKTR